MTFKSIALVASVLILSSSVNAAVITPVSVEVSSTFTYSAYDKNNLINGSGIDGVSHDSEWTNMWLNNGGVNSTLTFDLGDVFSLTSTDIWQYNASCCGLNRGVQTFDIYRSDDGVNFDLITDAFLTMSSGGLISAQTINFDTTAQFIRFDITSNYGAAYTGLSEVKFNSDISSVPVPAAAWLFGSGLLGLVGIARRKKA